MNKQKITEQILNLICTAEVALQLRYEPYISENHDIVEQNLSRVSAAFCGSWLGYHANVYYQGFGTPTPGDGFSVEWGLRLGHGMHGSSGWIEVTNEQVQAEIMKGVDSKYEARLDEVATAASTAFDESHMSMVTLLEVLLESRSKPILEEINKRIAGIKPCISSQNIMTLMTPKGQLVSRDMEALSHGLRPPPHASAQAWHVSKLSRFGALSDLIKEANKLLKYLEMHDLLEHKPDLPGTRVFIGHGRSPLWREFKDFIVGRLSLEWDEYNREPAAGFATKERLQSVLDKSCFAFLLMTGEDLHADDSVHARENVVHEVGLFQGKLGFRRAIVVLEEGCVEFSNIAGLNQIRFPKGNISACFEEIRRVLEREGILKS